jgi:CRP-like cAMP-binding protein
VYESGVTGEPDFRVLAQAIPFLRALPEADLERLRPYALCRRVHRGDRIWAEGDPTGEFTFLAQGHVKMVKAGETGREVIMELSHPGELLCANAVCNFAPYCCSSVAHEDAVDVVVIPRRDVLELIERSPTASRAFLREVTARGMGLGRRIEELASGQVERRIATLLLRLADQVGVVREDGTWISLALSRQDLADLCGTTVETAIRTMSRLSREAVVRTAARGFVVQDRSALEAVAHGERRAAPGPPRGRG